MFLISDVSRDGLGLTCVSATTPVFPGCRIERVRIVVPGFEEFEISGTLRYVDNNDQPSLLRYGLQVDDSALTAMEVAMARLLLRFGVDEDASTSRIKKAGFNCKEVRRLVAWRQVCSHHDYERVCRQRWEAYMLDGKFSQLASPDSVKDRYDKHSTIVYAEHRGWVIGSVRTTVCQDADDRFEIEEAGALPDWLPRERTAEISRLCVSGDWRGTDLPIGLAERAAEIVVKEGVDYAITSCTEDRVAFYRQLLFEPTGEILYLPAFKDIPHHRMVQDLRKTRSKWSENRFYTDVQRFLVARGI